MNRWKPLVFGLVIALLTGLSISHAQEEGAEEAAPGFEVEQESVSELMVASEEEAAENEMITDPEDEALDALLLNQEMTMFELIMKGGVVGGLIILLSCVALGLVIDYAITIRRAKLAPIEDIAAFKDLVEKKDFARLKEVAKEKPTFLSDVLTAGLDEINLGYPAMIKAMEDTAEARTARQARRIEHLNVIGNISPMMGLLGTVIGMLRCFNEISQVSGSIDPKQLAAGIFEALVTTCLGLIVAIPTLYFYAIFRNRLDELGGEASVAAEQIIASFKPGGGQTGS
ncbi:MAG: MotA/TolQ/ExbB proton channel family protein [Thermodesulfobacteriota bacterium]